MARSTMLPWSWIRVVKAATALSDAEKLIWIEDHGLYQGPEGSWAAHQVIAERLGKSANVVKVTRWRLKQLGLYRTVERPGCQSHGWIPDLPPACRPHEKPSPREVAILAGELDSHARVNRGSRAREPALTVQHNDTVNPGLRHRKPGFTPLRGEGGLQGGAPHSALSSQDDSPSAFRPGEGSVRDANGEAEGSARAEWRAIIRRNLEEDASDE